MVYLVVALDIKYVTSNIYHGKMAVVKLWTVKVIFFFPLLWELTLVCVLYLVYPIFYQHVQLLIWCPVNCYALNLVAYFLFIWIHWGKVYPLVLL